MKNKSHTQAILLLTVRFTRADTEAVKPLTPTEWGRFAEWLRTQELTPETLLHGQLPDILHNWQDASITFERLQALLNRGPALALSMEKWTRSGLWVLTRADADYPRRLKQRLGVSSPPVLFGCGNQNMLKGGGLAVVGSRNASETDLAYSRKLGALASQNGISIVSGAARGIDEAAMLAALEAEGTAVGFLANGLLRAGSSAKYRRYLMQKGLALVSSFNPEAGFHVGNAMQRNRYIYCAADAAVVVHSGKKGGTWNGARENLKRGWVPLNIKQTDDPDAGNSALVREGAKRISDTVEALDFESLFTPLQPQPTQRGDLFTWGATQVKGTSGSTSGYQTHHESPPAAGASFYDVFLTQAELLCSETPRSLNELVDTMGINKSQMNSWLEQAVADGHMKKTPNPERYQWKSEQQGTLPLE